MQRHQLLQIRRVLVALPPIERVPRQDRFATCLHHLLVMQQIGVAELRAQGKALAPVGHAHDVPVSRSPALECLRPEQCVPWYQSIPFRIYLSMVVPPARTPGVNSFLHEYNSWRLCSKAFLASFRRIHQVQSWRILFRSNSKVQKGLNGMGHMRSALA